MTETAEAAALETYDCVILSGGGAKGAYGAGVAKALEEYRHLKGLSRKTCYIGSSAGGLNAYMLAAKGADALIEFWLKTTNFRILGVGVTSKPIQGAIHWVMRAVWKRRPYSVYRNRALSRLIQKNAQLDKLQAPLILTGTDITHATLKAFYVSALLEELIAMDAQQPVRQRRLAHFRKIESNDILVRALLASAAIPIFFPPVELNFKIGDETEMAWYVDGGVGNHTPVREAAYFFRFLQDAKRGRPGVAFCVKQDPPRTITDGPIQFGLSGLFQRTLEVYHHVHMAPIITAWWRINREVQEQQRRVWKFIDWLKTIGLAPPVFDEISRKADDVFGKIGGPTARVDTPLLEIEPSSALGDALDFRPAVVKENIRHGYVDALQVLRRTSDPAGAEGARFLDEAEFQALMNRPIFP